ncbi:PAS domain S-box protein [Lacinutrix undariae]
MEDINKLFKLLENNTSVNSQATKFLTTIQEHLNFGTWIVNLKHGKSIWSDITKRIHEIDGDFNPTIEQVINFYLEGYNRDLIRKLFKDAQTKKEKFDVELELITQKGNKKWVRVIGYGVFENNMCTQVLGIVQDITIHKKHLKDLILKEKHISTTMDNAANGMALIDLEGKFIAVNKKMCQYFNYTKEELKQLFFKDIAHPDHHEITLISQEKLLSGEIDNIQLEKKYLSKDNKTVYCISSISLLRDEDNLPIHFIINVIDITKTKIIEQKRNILLEKTEEQNLRLLNFTHIVSHNLRSHTGNLEMLLDVMQDDVPDFVTTEYYPLLKQSVNNLSETIKNLNEVSTIKSNIDKNILPCKLIEYTKKVINNLNVKIVETNTEITLDIPKNIFVLATPMYLENILLNLISNAIDFKKPNTKPVIKICANKNKKHIKLSIEDNGLGIDLELHKDKIFGLYKTFHDHKETRGLGLFITKSQVDAIDAKIELTSKVNGGTTFTLFFKYEEN